MAKEKGETREVVREWQPTHDDSLARIQGTIDSWGRAPGEPAPPSRDYAAIEAAVDRLTKRVKTRKVVVKQTVTEYIDEEVPVEEAAAVEEAPAPLASMAPAEEPKKAGFFARRKAAKQEARLAKEPEFRVVEAAKPRTVTLDDDGEAWDPGAPARATEPAKPLQSKAAKRTAKKSAKKR